MFKKKHAKREAAGGEGGAGGGAPVVTKPPVDPAVLEQARTAEIEAMCKQHQIPDEVRNHLIALKAPIEMARGIVLNEMLARNKGMASMGGNPNPDMTEKEKAKYSMLRAIRAATEERLGVTNAWKEAGLEREVSLEIGKRSGKSTGGLFIPTNLPFAARAADYSFGTGAGLSGTSGGANLVATNLLSGSFIELLRNKARVFGLGAQMLSGLVGNVDIPRQKAAGQTYWVGEGGTLTQTGAQFDKISMTPKHIGALSVITRNMMQQSSPDVEMMARADLLSTIALGIDLAALSGSGTASQPLGIANQAGIGSVIGGVNGGALTLDNLIDLETFVAAANADEGSLAYLTNAKAVGTLKKLKSTTGQYLWTNSPMGQRSGTPGEINGYTVARTNQARSNLTKGTGTNLSEVFFGDWSQVLVGEWGVVEILPNPYATGLYEQGAVELRVLQTLDIAVRHAQSFAVMSDAITG
jgi:HK97 family phage major capsid protein